MNYERNIVLVFIILPTVFVCNGELNHATSAMRAEQLAEDGWLNITKDDSISLAHGTAIIRNKKTNARNVWVFGARFHYSAALHAVRVMIKPSGSPAVSLSQPLVVSVRSTAGGHTFNVPNAVYAKNGTVIALQDTAARVLCPGPTGYSEHITVTVGTGYLDPKNVNKAYTFNIGFMPIAHWSLGLNTPLQYEAQPSDPAVFSFTWPSSAPATVIVTVDTVKNSEICATVVIQHRTCPLALTTPELTIDSKYFSIRSSGHLTVRRSEFPDGFFVIVLPGVSDQLCDPNAPVAAPPGRKKTVKVTVNPQLIHTEYFAVPVVIAILLVLAGCVTACVKRSLRVPLLDISEDPQAQERARHDSADTDELVIDQGLGLRTSQDDGNNWAIPPQLSPISLLVGAALVLLAMGGDAVFSSIRAQSTSGNFDICYRNELCDHTTGGVVSANHILVRIPYIGAAIGLFITVYRQQSAYSSATADGTVNVGVAHDFSLLNNICLSLLIQGVLSAIYSVCPSPHVSELDAAFVVFTMTSLAVKLFQTRRGITVSGHYAPLVMTCVFVACGLALRATGGVWYGWLILAMLHVLTAGTVTAQLYVLGSVYFSLNWMKRAWADRHLAVESPNHHMNRATSIIAVLFNIAIAVACLAAGVETITQYGMIFLLVHTVIYLTYYHLLKTVGAQETGVWSSRAHLTLGVVLMTACVIIVCGFSTFSTSLTPAVSRLLNRNCIGKSPLDIHDVWHLLMAPALFFLSLGVMLLDDDLMLTPRITITKF